MGPPIFIGGNVRVRNKPRHAAQSFNGATDFHRWKSPTLKPCLRLKSRLQWGHRFSSVEIPRPRRFPRSPRPASMGPPIFIGGNLRGFRPFRRSRSASMGPPIFIGGNDSGSPRTSCITASFNGATDFHRWKSAPTMEERAMSNQLQWGHRFSSVEISHDDAHDAKPLRLQWGHRFSSVEMASPVSVMPYLVGLQWGHRFSSVEMPRSSSQRVGGRGLQWGHRFSSVEIAV